MNSGESGGGVSSPLLLCWREECEGEGEGEGEGEDEGGLDECAHAHVWVLLRMHLTTPTHSCTHVTHHVVDHGCFERILVGAGPAHHLGDAVQPSRRDGQEGPLDLFNVVQGRHHS